MQIQPVAIAHRATSRHTPATSTGTVLTTSRDNRRLTEEHHVSPSDTSVAQAEAADETPIEWVYPGAEAFAWQRDREHWPNPMPPMELWLHKHWAKGIDRAWDEAAMEPPAMFYRFQYVGPFLYARETMPEPAQMIRMALRYREVAAEHGGALAFWENVCRPRIEEACREL